MSTAPHPPQLLLSTAVLTQVPPQSVSPAGQAQPPAWHVFPPAQVNCEPQPPQLVAFGVAFVVSLMQMPLHNDSPWVVHWHWPVVHCVPLGHTCEAPEDPHAPQLFLSVFVLTHVPPQSVSPAGQAQPPPWQVLPPVQVNCEPQPPQLVAFGVVFAVSLTQMPLQSVSPGVVQAHWPPLH
jgi:hypothetical protein